jgi:hypothetical protein
MTFLLIRTIAMQLNTANALSQQLTLYFKSGTVRLNFLAKQKYINKTVGFHSVGQKKIPTVGVFPTVSVFSYGQINPTVKMPRLPCTQFVVPPLLGRM